MEKYSATCRLILVCSSPSKVIEPVRSRCLGIRVAAPSQGEVMAVLTATAGKEGLTLPPGLAAKIAAQSGRNVRRALLMLEAAKVAQYPFTQSQAVPSMDYERYIGTVAVDIAKEQSPRALLLVRARLYELLVNCIPADVVIKRLLAEMLGKVAPAADIVKHELAAWAAHYEHRLQLGSKELFHIEAMVARFMAVIKANPGCLVAGSDTVPREWFLPGGGPAAAHRPAGPAAAGAGGGHG
jgi:replication factor C subunit 3/5